MKPDRCIIHGRIGRFAQSMDGRGSNVQESPTSDLAESEYIDERKLRFAGVAR
jgi:hypothetical protein